MPSPSTLLSAGVLLLALLASPSAAQAGWTDLGQGLAGTQGVPNLTNTWGTLSAGANYGWELNHCAPDSMAILVVGASAIDAPFKGGVLVPYPHYIYFPGTWTGPGGLFTFGGVWPATVPAGAPIYFQYWIADPLGPHGWAASNAVMNTTT